MKLGIIGTSAISQSFWKAAQETGYYDLAGVYSRQEKTGQTFLKALGQSAPIYTDLEDFLASPVEVVYIASPNSLHVAQASAALQTGKHVICEKPLVTRPEELRALRRLAESNHLFLFEAARHLHERSLTQIKAFLEKQDIIGASFSFSKYSSKMGELLAGKIPNVFSEAFAGGALMDLGIYPLYLAHALFGAPDTASYQAQQLPSSIDLRGNGLLTYPGFDVTIQCGKDMTSFHPTEIYTRQGTLVLDHCQNIQTARFFPHQGPIQDLGIIPPTDWMMDEARDFAETILTQDHVQAKAWLDLADLVHHTLFTMRQDAGIHFKADPQ